MTVLRTPDERFSDLPEFPFEPHYMQIGDTRLHYVDEGNGFPIVLLHGEPTWSFLYRHIIARLRSKYRVIAPDLVGFGRSDKYAAKRDYSYNMHTAKFDAFIDALSLDDVTLVVHDWGGPIGLRTAIEMQDRFSRLVLLNTFLSTGQPPNRTFRLWRTFARYSPVFTPSLLVQMATVRWLSRDILRAYNAPFPARRYKAGARVFPLLVPDAKDHPAVPAMRATFRALRRWEKPTLVMFSDKDPILGGLETIFRRLIPGTKGQPQLTIHKAGHFLQEDQGEEIARHIHSFMQR